MLLHTPCWFFHVLIKKCNVKQRVWVVNLSEGINAKLLTAVVGWFYFFMHLPNLQNNKGKIINKRECKEVTLLDVFHPFRVLKNVKWEWEIRETGALVDLWEQNIDDTAGRHVWRGLWQWMRWKKECYAETVAFDSPFSVKLIKW